MLQFVSIRSNIFWQWERKLWINREQDLLALNARYQLKNIIWMSFVCAHLHLRNLNINNAVWFETSTFFVPCIPQIETFPLNTSIFDILIIRHFNELFLMTDMLIFIKSKIWHITLSNSNRKFLIPILRVVIIFPHISDESTICVNQSVLEAFI